MKRKKKKAAQFFQREKTLHNLHFEQKEKVNNWKAAE